MSADRRLRWPHSRGRECGRDPDGVHGRSARDALALAQGRLSLQLALEIASMRRSAASRDGAARADPADEHREPTWGRSERSQLAAIHLISFRFFDNNRTNVSQFVSQIVSQILEQTSGPGRCTAHHFDVRDAHHRQPGIASAPCSRLPAECFERELGGAALASQSDRETTSGVDRRQ
jgi:hypothetical protein